MPIVVALIVAALVALFERGRVAPTLGIVRRALDSRWAPHAFGIAFGAIVWWTWGQTHPIGVLHDELAYLLQARLFREWHWTAAGPPMPEFFAQAHVLNDPVVASKYPPGHSLLLALGDHVGMPALVVVALAALRGGLAFALARRLTNNGAIALATGMFLLRGQSLYRGASFFSETTTSAMLLVAWYAMLRWREAEGGRRWMALMAFALGWCAITRPFSTVFFAIPIAAVVLHALWRTRRWRELAIGLAVGSAVVAILPLWSARTTGNWLLWPSAVYTRDYMPFDRPHFGYDSTPPRKTPPADLAFVNASLDTVQRAHTIAALPSIARQRVVALARQTWWDPVVEGGLAFVGLFAAPPAALVGIATTILLFAGYLAHPTWSDWTIYYMEIAPVLEFLLVCGLALVFRVLAGESQRERDWASGPRASVALLVALVFSLPMLGREIRYDRHFLITDSRYQREFHNATKGLPSPSTLFVRHAKWHQGHWSLVVNEPDFAAARTWIAYDRGDSANAALMRLTPRRQAFLFDEARRSIAPYSPLAVTR